MRASGSFGVGFYLHWPTNQLAFGYVAGNELSIGSISSFTGHLLLGIFELRLVKISVDRDAKNLSKDVEKLLSKLNKD
jgi:hypothetical protein